MRIDGTEWQRQRPADGVPTLGWGSDLEQAPDGELWMTPGSLGTPDGEVPCSERWGVARFDGLEWQYFLSGTCVTAMDVAPGGTAWLLADGSDDYVGHGLYGITPEAVEAAE